MPRKPTRRLAAQAVAGRTPTEQFELEQFANRLQSLRVAKGWSQSDLAREVWGKQTNKRTGKISAKNRDRISTYEMGKSWPDPHNLLKIAAALGVAPEELAPDLTGATVERQNPDFATVSVPGHPGKIMLRINRLVSFDQMTRIAAILNEVEAPGG